MWTKFKRTFYRRQNYICGSKSSVAFICCNKGGNRNIKSKMVYILCIIFTRCLLYNNTDTISHIYITIINACPLQYSSQLHLTQTALLFSTVLQRRTDPMSVSCFNIRHFLLYYISWLKTFFLKPWFLFKDKRKSRCQIWRMF